MSHVGYTVLYDYEIGEVISVTNVETEEIRKAEVVSHNKTEKTINIRFLDTAEEETWHEEDLTYRANLPLHTMLEMVEGLMSVWMRATTIVKEDEREHVMATIKSFDRMIGESAADNFKLLGMPQDKLCVVLDEEYGYRHHIWFPGMTETEFLAWWENLESVSGFFFDPASTLPGEVVTLDTREELALWRALDCANNIHKAHIHTDGDSFMTTPDGVNHHHKGYDEHYYDSKPGDTCCKVLEDGTQIMGKLDDNLEFVPDENQDHCCGCPHKHACSQEEHDEEQVDVPDLPDDSGEGEGR